MREEKPRGVQGGEAQGGDGRWFLAGLAAVIGVILLAMVFDVDLISPLMGRGKGGRQSHEPSYMRASGYLKKDVTIYHGNPPNVLELGVILNPNQGQGARIFRTQDRKEIWMSHDQLASPGVYWVRSTDTALR